MPSYIPIPISDVVEEQEKPSLTYALDLERGRILGKTDGVSAVQQAISKAILTPRFKCLVYDNQYGSEIKNTILAGDTTPEFVETELPRLVEDALKPDSRVLCVRDFTFSFTGDTVQIKFTADTIFGEAAIEGVI
ncbi:MAG: DUF2634 domain-containing protein [Bacteroides sp.]